ncbi:DUF1697 domain-containing protein [Frigoriflavimonas asaccharolytica]|uniref:Uncharacterized protein (DUF1697 family) n=1 Tax=Frigoriflavimonas asaccharolytica TaxID=2735899 RepID=A0A8J8G7S3_9FLAO|nr:DUF1697 domain-containing protein [Frigoriflavimonas asaccharolytica]NRS92846.1 uncharacterized protein (DUF1697 family) [Frigoriflavimonas asaccharolytica]
MKYCAFLRGINVNGTSMKMEEVRKVFEANGMIKVSSVLATGNILFESSLSSDKLSIILKKALSDYFRYDANIFIKTKEEIENIITKNPFESNAEFHIYYFISENGVAADLLSTFDAGKKTDGEFAELIETNFYWQIKKGLTLDSDFGKVLGKKNFKDKMTSRNLNTIEKIVNKL